MTNANELTKDDESRQSLDESQFIRHRLHDTDESLPKQYARLVLARPSWWSVIRYELIGFLGMLPGALGLGIRRFAFRLLLADAGPGTVFGRGITLRHADNIHLGRSVTLDDFCLLDARGAGTTGISIGDRVIVNRNASVQAKDGAISIGNDTSVGAYSHIISQGPIEIGDNVSIAGGTMIAGGRYEVEFSPDDPSKKARFTGGAIVIESNVRIGMRSVILDGVRIGRDAIVAPGSVVFDDVPAATVVFGCPARPLRKRPDSASKPVPRSHGQGSRTAVKPASGYPTSRSETVKQAIRAYLEQTHFAKFGPGQLSDADSLFDSRIIDSVGLVGLITMLEEHFEIELMEDDLVPENLDTVDGLAAVVQNKLK